MFINNQSFSIFFNFSYIVFYFFYGFITIIIQIILLRQISLLTNAHELLLGIMLASWLVFTGIGSFSRGLYLESLNIYNSIIKKIKINLNLLLILYSFFAGIFVILAFFIPLLIKHNLFTSELPNFLEFFFIILATLFLPCFFIGLLFPLANEILLLKLPDFRSGKIYLWECFGAVGGGLFYTFFITKFSNYFFIVFLLSITLIFVAFIVISRRIVHLIGLIFFIIIYFSIFNYKSTIINFEENFWKYAWHNFTLIKQIYTPYSHLAISEIQNQKILFSDGLTTDIFPDAQLYEETVHFSLLVHKNPKDILILGNPFTGILKEVLKYRLKNITVVNLDSKLKYFLEEFLPVEDKKALSSKKIKVIFDDPRKFLSNDISKFDVILMLLPEPVNAGINRFYTLEFFRIVKDRINPGGIFSFTLPSSENYLPPVISYFNGSIYATLKNIFPYIEILPGDKMHILASDRKIIFDTQIFIDRIQNKNIKNEVVVPQTIPYYFNPGRISYVKNTITQIKNILINRDLFPVTYFYSWKIWWTKYVSQRYFLGIIIPIVILIWIIKKFFNIKKIRWEYFFIFIVSFISFSCEFILIIIYQISYGTLFWKLGVLFSSFMVGMTIGSLLGLFSYKKLHSKMVIKFFIIFLFSFLLLLFFILDNYLNEKLISLFIGISGLFTGFLFVFVSELMKTSQLFKKNLARLYAFDLYGAATGSLILGGFLIPIIGLKYSLLFLSFFAILLFFKKIII